MIKVGIGQDSHCLQAGSSRPLLLGGVKLEESFELIGNSDADVVLHALTNAISGITGKPILGAVADKMCEKGITDSSEYLKVALLDLENRGYLPVHVSISVEAKYPKLMPVRQKIVENIAMLMSMNSTDVCLTATTGEGLTSFGQGKGIACTCVITVQKK
jgi:2-C-methyl-D-erythritol 2,4-cyclodiphosphate synthase